VVSRVLDSRNVRLTFWLRAVGLLVILGEPDAALAWGPATHVGLACSVLEHLGLLPAAVAAILSKHAISYIYGSVAADVVFAKRLSRVKQFCHHWSTAMRLLEGAEDARGRAFAYGYLSHLAADTVAHGKYVPHQLMLSDCTINFGHLYWELRADATATESTWQLLDSVLKVDHESHHEALAGLMTDTFLSYELNRVLFDRLNAMTVHQGFRRTIGVWGRYSRWYLPPGLIEGYRIESVERIQAILSEGARSALLHEDPNGTSALMRARIQRRELQRMKRRGLPVHRRLREASDALAPKRWHVAQPEALPA